MAWFEVDIFERTVIVDLHNYSRKTAVIVVREKIKEAYEHGFRHIRFIHGAAHIKEKTDGGSIKFALHSMLRKGELAKWVQDKDSGIHKVLDGQITFALRKNPAPVAKYGIRTPDAIQLASVISKNGGVFITNDDRLETVEDIRVLTLKNL